MNLNITLNKPYLNAAGGVTVTFAFTEAVTGFTSADISTAYGNVTLQGSSDGGKTWTGVLDAGGAKVEGASDKISVDLRGVLDSGGVAGSGTATSNPYWVDTVGPSVVSFGSIKDVNMDNIRTEMSVVFSEKVRPSVNALFPLNLFVEDVFAGNDYPDVATEWTYLLFLPVMVDGGHYNQATLSLDKVIDQYGNVGVGSVVNPNYYTVDRMRPTATVTVDQAIIGTQSQVTIRFDEIVSGLDINDFIVNNGTLGNLVALNPDNNNASATWSATLTVTPGSDSINNKITLNMLGLTDLAGNTGDGTVASNAYQVKTIAPTVVIGISDNHLKAGDTATVTLSFSEKVSGLTLAAIHAPNGTLSNLVSTDGGVNWTASFTPATATAGNNEITLVSNTVQDLAGNYVIAASSGNYAVDTVAPTATIVVDTTSLIRGQSSLVTITFSEAVSGLSVNEFSVQHATLDNLASSDGGRTWTATLRPDDNVSYQGYLQLVGSGNVADLAGNKLAGNYDSALLSYDTTIPSGTIEVLDRHIGIAGAQVKIQFSESINVLHLTSMSAEHGTLSNLQNVDGYNWTATFTPDPAVSAGNGKMFLVMDTIRDNAGNFGSGVAISSSYSVDNARPTVTITLSDNTLTPGEHAIVTLAFSEAVSGFDLNDISAPYGTLANLATSNGGVTWTATYTPDDGVGVATNHITLAASSYADLAGNTGDIATSTGFSVRTLRPTARVDVSDSALKIGQTSVVSVIFSEAVSGLDIDDFSVANGALSNLASSDGGMTWSATLTPTANISAANNIVTLNNTGYVNSQGNSGIGSTDSGNYAIDTKAPQAVITLASNTLASGQSTLVTFQFSEAVSGFDNNDLTVSQGMLSNVSSNDGITWTATFTASAPVNRSMVVIQLNQAGVQDTAGNAGVGTVANPSQALPPSGPSITTGMADGVSTTSYSSIDPATGLSNTYLSVPTVGTVVDDSASQLPGVADIPLTIGAARLLVGLPQGVRFDSSSTDTPQSGDLLLRDVQHRIDSITRDSVMDGAFADYLQTLPAGSTVASATLVLSASSMAPGRPLVINGNGAALALVIDARALPAGTVILLNDVGFAAVSGNVTLRGGAGDNHVIGDGGAQNILLGAGDDVLQAGAGDDIVGSAGGNDVIDGGDGNDLVFGGAGNDRLTGGSGNDVLQGGRSDQGDWSFHLNAQGNISAVHTSLDGASETLTLNELVAGNPLLDFAHADATILGNLASLYHAAFGRVADLAGFSSWIRAGVSIEQAANSFAASAEFQQGAGKLGNSELVQTLYRQAFGAEYTEAHGAEQTAWIAKLDAASNGSTTRAELLLTLALATKGRWAEPDGSLTLSAVTLSTEQGWISGSGDDVLHGGGGNDRMVGGDGIDTVLYDGKLGDYQFILSAQGEIRVRDNKTGDIDTLLQIEKGQFSDGMVDLGFTNSSAANVQQVGLMYQTVLDRAADLAGLGFWDAQHLNAATLAQFFIDSAEFQSRYGGLDNSAFAQTLVSNALNHAPAADALQNWTSYLDTHSRAEMVVALIGSQDVLAAQYTGPGLVLAGS